MRGVRNMWMRCLFKKRMVLGVRVLQIATERAQSVRVFRVAFSERKKMMLARNASSLYEWLRAVECVEFWTCESGPWAPPPVVSRWRLVAGGGDPENGPSGCRDYSITVLIASLQCAAISTVQCLVRNKLQCATTVLYNTLQYFTQLQYFNKLQQAATSVTCVYSTH